MRLFLLDQTDDFSKGCFPQSHPLQRCGACEQLVKQYTERIHIATGVDPQRIHFGLFGTHVLEGSDQCSVLGEQCFFGQLLFDGFGDAEVDDLGNGFVVVHRDEHVGGLDVPMDDALLMGVLDGLAHRNKQFESFAGCELFGVGILEYGDAVDEFHDEEGTATFGRSGVIDFGDVDVVHHGQGLAFGFESSDDLFGIHPRFDDLEGDLAMDWCLLLGHEDHTHATLADLLQEFVAIVNDCPNGVQRWLMILWSIRATRLSSERLSRLGGEEAADTGMSGQQLFDTCSQAGVARTGLIQISGQIGMVRYFQGFKKDMFGR